MRVYKMPGFPILTYHSVNIDGNDYASNDHVAFQHDLRLVDSLGYKVIPLYRLVDALLTGSPLPEKSIAVTFDDGTDFDFHDLPHPTWGTQRSMLNIMRDFIRECGKQRQPMLHATAFVIASPLARQELDRRSMVGANWYRDTWWKMAVESRLLGVANHSWDHNHPLVSSPSARKEVGTFRCVADRNDADNEILQAHRYISSVAPNSAAALFAYPYGEFSDYLLKEYLPLGESCTGTKAAFTTEPRHATPKDSRWQLPRYMCGAHWRTPEGLRDLLTSS